MLRLGRESLWTKITKAFGAQDVQVGDATFDDAFIISCSSPPHVGHILTADIRKGILWLPRTDTLMVRGNVAHWERIGLEKDAEVLQYLLDLMTGIASKVVDLEAPGQAPVSPQPQASGGHTHYATLAVCPNCGGDIDWDTDNAKDVVTCSYCGTTTKMQLKTIVGTSR